VTGSEAAASGNVGVDAARGGGVDWLVSGSAVAVEANAKMANAVKQARRGGVAVLVDITGMVQRLPVVIRDDGE
jgi:hypothetical protein